MADQIDWKSRAERAERSCAEMREALSIASQDIREWLQLAERHREALGVKADFEPYCPTTFGIEASENRLKIISKAFSTTCGEGYVSKDQLEKAEKACCEAKNVVRALTECIDDSRCALSDYDIQHALSTDCGSNYVRREELEAAREELFAHAKVAARVEMELKEELNAAKAEVETLREVLESMRPCAGSRITPAMMNTILKALGKEGE